jgi:hypothetical protein
VDRRCANSQDSGGDGYLVDAVDESIAAIS